MQAVVLEEKAKLAVHTRPDPDPAPGHVRLQVRAASICGSDIMRYTKGHRMYPLVLGHEVAGIIDRVGESVDPGLVGRHAAVIPLVPCFECDQCRAGRYSACRRYSFIGSRQDGGFAGAVDLPLSSVLPLPNTVPFEAAALIEPSTVARHILDLGSFQPGQSVMVLGAGSIGLMAVQWLRILGAGLIIASDVVDENLSAARDLGGQVLLNARRDDVPAKIKALTGAGVDLALETAGSPQTLAQTIQVTRPRGQVVCGGNQPLDASLPMSFIEDFMRKELRLSGCFMSYSAPFPGHEWTDTVEELVSGRLDMQTMISHRFPLAKAPEVFASIADHTLAHRKIILLPEG